MMPSYDAGGFGTGAGWFDATTPPPIAPSVIGMATSHAGTFGCFVVVTMRLR